MDGYTQLNLGGKLRGFQWGKNAFQRYMKMLNLKPDENVANVLQSKVNSEHSALILYCGLMMNCFAKQQDPDFTFEDCVKWDEKMNGEDEKKILKAIQENEWFSDFNEDVKKKEEELTELLLNAGGNKKKGKSS